MTCCIEDIPEEEIRELLFSRVLRMTGKQYEKLRNGSV